MGIVNENVSLQTCNTFGIQANARYFTEPSDTGEITEILQSSLIKKNPLLILGGGSNILFTRDFEGVVMRPAIKGIEKIKENDKDVIIRAGAGENWDSFVAYCVQNEWSGIENLSWIPGTVGASPVQNIGAYGAEIMDYIDAVEGYYIQNSKKFRLSGGECHFSYRNSIFKNELKNKVVITHVNYRLNKIAEFNTSYPDLAREMDDFDETSIQNIRQAVINIRKAKLPDPAETGNAGSFFKNPVATSSQAANLKNHYPTIPLYPMENGTVKVSAAWLIEQSGWKGRNCGKAGTHKRQPLILINLGGATGQDILECATRIQKAVKSHFGIGLEMEVNVV
ncbi:MAG TPA: UDP-N-acetylmuramate dehydrogenase [Bacteroidales bacterium]|nr:UDP-N-acetylmuramate dehydrogenase [Bacteroidales bacterium]